MSLQRGDTPDDVLSHLLVRYDESLARDTPVDDHETSAELGAELTAELAGARRCLELIERVRRREQRDDRSSNSGFCTATVPPPAAAEHQPATLGRFYIERELGRGGLGVVYLAYDPKLDREVALKVPRADALVSAELRRRFLREAEAAARLNHPHLVAVHDAGEDGPLCYIAAEYCAGPTLAAWLAAQPGPIAIEQAATLVRQLAEAVQYAHGRGVLHRDIKPGNVLLAGSAYGADTVDASKATGAELCPKLTDFGMAKLLERDDSETRDGALIGTPEYMAPEQAGGQVRDLDARADVYALGAVLYELLTGRLPHEGASETEIRRRVLFEEPIAPRRHRPQISRDLEAIVLLCLARQREARYATAQQLADDLGRFLAGQPTEARPLGPAATLIKWTRRRPALAALAALGALATVLLLGVTLAYNARLSGANASLRLEREKALASEHDAREYAYGADMMLAQKAWQNAAAGEARALLKRQIPRPGQADLRAFEWHYLSNMFERGSIVVAEQSEPVWSLAVSHDDALVATGDPQSVIRLWDRRRRALVRELRGHEKGHVDQLVFLTDGQHLVSSGDDRTLRWWDVGSGQCSHVSREHTDWVGALGLSPDGTQLASGGGGGRVLLWNAAEHTLTGELYRHPAAVRWLVFHPTKPWIVSACEQGEVHVWDYLANRAPDGYPDGQAEGDTDPAWRGAVFDLTNRSLYAGNRDKMFRWKFGNGGIDTRRTILPAFSDKTLSVAFLAGPRVLAEGGDNTPAIFTRRAAHDETLVHTHCGHSDAVRCLAALSDGYTLLSGSEDGTVRQWDLKKEYSTDQVIDVRSAPQILQWSQTSDRLWVKQAKEQIFTIDEPAHATVTEHSQAIPLATRLLPAKGRRVVGIGGDNGVYVFDEQRPKRPQFVLPGEATDVAIDERGTRLAYAQGKVLTWYDVATGAVMWQAELHDAVTEFEVVDDHALVVACDNGVLVRLSAIDGKVHAQSQAHRSVVEWIDVSDDGRRIVTACRDRTVRIFDAAELTEITALSRPVKPKRVWFFDGDRRLLVAEDKQAAVINPRTGQELLALDGGYRDAALSPDGRWLAEPYGTEVRLHRLAD